MPAIIPTCAPAPPEPLLGRAVAFDDDEEEGGKSEVANFGNTVVAAFITGAHTLLKLAIYKISDWSERATLSKHT